MVEQQGRSGDHGRGVHPAEPPIKIPSQMRASSFGDLHLDNLMRAEVGARLVDRRAVAAVRDRRGLLTWPLQGLASAAHVAVEEQLSTANCSV
jgi:hypothetical protein